MRKGLMGLLAGAALLAMTAPADAAIVIDATLRGWCSRNEGFDPAIYAIETSGPSTSYWTGRYANTVRRSFFVFPLTHADLGGNVITGATLSVFPDENFYHGDQDTETLGFFDVSPSSLTGLIDGLVTQDFLAALFDDLGNHSGTGTEYTTVYVDKPDQADLDDSSWTPPPISIDMTEALGDLQAAIGESFAVGAALVSLSDSGTDHLFIDSLSDPKTKFMLEITTGPPGVIPEPSTLAIWSLLGAIGLTVGWWRRRRA